MRFISILGLIALLGVAWLMSSHKSKIRPRIIIWGVGLQLLFALIILSQNIMSFIGMYIFLCMMLIYLFSDKFVGSNETQAKVLVFGGVGVAAATVIAITIFLDGHGLAIYFAIAAVAVILFGIYNNEKIIKMSITNGEQKAQQRLSANVAG